MGNIKLKGGSYYLNGDVFSGSSGAGLGGTNYLFVKGSGTPSENAAELQAAYDEAKTKVGPEELAAPMWDEAVAYPKNSSVVYSEDGELFLYKNTSGELPAGSPPPPTNWLRSGSGIIPPDLIMVVIAPGIYTFGSVKFPVDTPYINIVSLTGNPDVMLDGINVTANNVYLKGLNCGTNAFAIHTNLISTNLNKLVCDYCVGGDFSFGLYGNVSGEFNYCIGGNKSFGGGFDGTASGEFNYCTGGSGAFGGGGNIASGTFTDCTGGNDSFGGSGVFSGTATNCTGGSGSFGGGIATTARLYYCKLTSGSFGSPVEGGKLVLCIDGNDAIITIN